MGNMIYNTKYRRVYYMIQLLLIIPFLGAIMFIGFNNQILIIVGLCMLLTIFPIMIVGIIIDKKCDLLNKDYYSLEQEKQELELIKKVKRQV